MKKRLFFGTSIIAIIISVSILIFSVYAVVSQEFLISNIISFTGGEANVKFSLDAQILGATKKDLHDEWDYEYENIIDEKDHTKNWGVGDIQFDSSDPQNMHITYIFSFVNTSDEFDLTITFTQSAVLHDNLEAHSYVNVDNTQDNEGTVMVLPKTKSGVIYYKLTIKNKNESVESNVKINLDIKAINE